MRQAWRYLLSFIRVLQKNIYVSAESVAVSPDGTLYMLDKFGNVLRASGGSTSKPEFITHLGPGRPLGFHFNAKGDLFICNAGTVGHLHLLRNQCTDLYFDLNMFLSRTAWM